jgi:hypothetical protein
MGEMIHVKKDYRSNCDSDEILINKAIRERTVRTKQLYNKRQTAAEGREGEHGELMSM